MGQTRVVVSGLGVISPVGNSVPAFEAALAAGVSGVGPITQFDASGSSCRIAAEVKGFEPEQYLEKREVGRTDRVQQLALAAAQEAIVDAGLDLEAEDRERIGVYVTSGIGGDSTFESEVLQLGAKGPSRVSPFFIPKVIIDSIPATIAMRFRLYGGTNSVVSACSSGTQMLGEAFEAIRRGDVDVIVTGAADAAVIMSAVGGFANMRALSTRNETRLTRRARSTRSATGSSSAKAPESSYLKILTTRWPEGHASMERFSHRRSLPTRITSPCPTRRRPR